jgi:hypothetical protein
MPNRTRTPKRPRDFNSRAFDTVAKLTGTAPPEPPAEPVDPIRSAAAELGRRGGLKGGRVRSERMTPEERRESARRAAIIRWKKPEP